MIAYKYWSLVSVLKFGIDPVRALFSNDLKGKTTIRRPFLKLTLLKLTSQYPADPNVL